MWVIQMAKRIRGRVVLVVIVVHIVMDIVPDLEQLIVIAHQPLHKAITLLLKMEELVLLGQDRSILQIIMDSSPQLNRARK
jgi:hypothetical protein